MTDNARGADLIRAVWLAAGLVLLLWLLHRLISALMLMFLALVLAIALNAPVRRLRARGMRRGWATAIVAVAVVILLAGLGWLVVPRVGEQLANLVAAAPKLAADFSSQLARWLRPYPDLQQKLRLDAASITQALPSAMHMVTRVGTLSITVLGLLLGLAALASLVLYLVLDPKPLFDGYLRSLPPQHRAAGKRALLKSCDMVVGWMRSNLIVGAIEAVLVAIFLSWLGIPGALVWAALAFFAEFVPRVGGYIMAFPPVLVGFSESPLTALWIALFYLVMNEALADLLVPYIRGEEMDIHPAVVIAVTIGMAMAFGLVGALIATPAAAFIVSYYREFYLARR